MDVIRKHDAVVHERDEFARENRELRETVRRYNAPPSSNTAVSGSSKASGRHVPNNYPNSKPNHSPEDLLKDNPNDCQNVQLTSSAGHYRNLETTQLSLALSSTPHNSTSTAQNNHSTIMRGLVGTLDYDQIALDFVLTLERPCLPHIRYLVGRANNPTGRMLRRPNDVPDDGENEQISGHALMASCPPPEFVLAHPGDECEYEMPTMAKAHLVKLLGLCEQLPGLSDEELPPIKAWVKVTRDERFPRLNDTDFRTLKEELLPTVQCYR